MAAVRMPDNARLRPGYDPTEDCQKVVNKMYYGDENATEGPGKRTAFRGAVCLGAVLSKKLDGETVISVVAAYVIDDRVPEYALAMAEQLRAMADRLEKEVAS